jgi:hypothetical protein
MPINKLKDLEIVNGFFNKKTFEKLNQIDEIYGKFF